MSKLEEIKIELKGIASILKDKNSFVPRYQRSYAWKDENVKNLYQDIGTAIASGASEYFLGSVVISQKVDSKPEIVDGQQRLATVCILLGAIRDYFQSLDTAEGKERSQMIFNEYLANKDMDTLELIPKLHLNDADQNYFMNRVLSPIGDEKRNILASKKSHERINTAANLAKKHVEYIVGITGEPTKTLIQWINYLRDKAKVIAVRVPDESNAFTIFETLNDRGLALAVSDLLKNYLFYKSDDRISEVQYQWIQMLSTIENAEDEQAVVTFIRHLWSSKNGLVREKDLFVKIKENITSKSEAVDLSKDLYEKSLIYSAIITCDDNYWSNFSTSAKTQMEMLNIFNMVQIRPLLLSTLSKFSSKDSERMLNNLVNWSVRFLIVGGLGGGALETKYCDAATKINKGEITNADMLTNFMLPIVPNDSEFSSSFSNATVSKNYLARYYLRTLETAKRGLREPELVPNTANDVITIEHILPQNPSEAWGHITPDDVKANYKRIGNMTLLKKSINSDIGNEGFVAKKPYFSSSEYQLTKEVADYEEWTIASIDKRQHLLAELAILAWPMKA